MTFRRFQDQTGSSIADDISAATRFKPVTKEDLSQAYKPYEDKLGGIAANRKTTDMQLYQRSVDKVIAWWKRQQKAKSAKPATPKPPAATAPPANGGRAGDNQDPSYVENPDSYGGRGAAGGNRGAVLPDTAMGAGGPVKKLAPIESRSQKEAKRESATSRDAQVREQQELRKQQTSRPLTSAQVYGVLTAMKVRKGVVPPASALKNKAALRNWVIRNKLQGTSVPVVRRVPPPPRTVAPKRAPAPKPKPAPKPVKASSSRRVGTNVRQF